MRCLPPKSELIFALVVTAVLFLASPTPAQGPDLGRQIPEFSVSDGFDNELTAADLSGRVALIFYEHKDATKINGRLKDRLKDALSALDQDRLQKLFAAVVIDAREAWWPATVLWKSAFIEESKKEGVPIYGDWDGQMLERLDLVAEDTNLLVIDADGRIRYFNSGPLDPETDSREIIDALDEAVTEVLAETGRRNVFVEPAPVAEPAL